MDTTTAPSLAAMAAFMQEFRGLVDRERPSDRSRLVVFLDDYRRYLSSPLRKTRFNVLDVTGVGNDEVKHSSILAWLLAPHGSHGCGTSFLDLFLRTAGIVIPEEHLSGCYVRTEFSADESIIDILVCKPREFLVYIENKTLSAEGVEQVDREYRDMLRVGKSVGVQRDRMFPVFLSPRGRPPISGDPRPWRPISYGRLARILEATLPELHGRKISFFVEDLIEQYDRWSIA